MPGIIKNLENLGDDDYDYKSLIETNYLSHLRVRPFDWNFVFISDIVVLQNYYAKLSAYVEMVEQTIDLEKLDKHVYIIKPEFDESLRKIADKLYEVRSQCLVLLWRIHYTW